MLALNRLLLYREHIVINVLKALASIASIWILHVVRQLRLRGTSHRLQKECSMLSV
jgi:uncharacterized membrane protein YqjE